MSIGSSSSVDTGSLWQRMMGQIETRGGFGWLMGEANQGEDGALQEQACACWVAMLLAMRVERGLGFSQPQAKDKKRDKETRRCIRLLRMFFKIDIIKARNTGHLHQARSYPSSCLGLAIHPTAKSQQPASQPADEPAPHLHH